MLKVKISNFQSIYDAYIEVEGLTVVTGPSDMGKSALIRAVEAALFHRSGDSFVSHGEDYSTVMLSWKGDKPFSIVWRKGEKPGRGVRPEKVNEFVVDGALLMKVGRAQPQEIADLGFRSVDFDGLKIALQVRRQRGVALRGRTYAPFVVGFSPSDAEKVLSRMVQSDVYSMASRFASQDLSRARSRLSSIVEELTVAAEELRLFLPLKDIEQEWEDIEEIRAEVREGLTVFLQLEVKSKKYFALLDLPGDPPEMEEPPPLGNYLPLTSLSVRLTPLLDLPEDPPEMEDPPTLGNYVPLKALSFRLLPLVGLPEDPSEMGEPPSLGNYVPLKALSVRLTPLLDLPEDLPELYDSPDPGGYFKLRPLSLKLSSLEDLPGDLPELPDVESIVGEIDNLVLLSSIAVNLSLCDLEGGRLSSLVEDLEEQIKVVDSELKEFDTCPLCESRLEHAH